MDAMQSNAVTYQKKTKMKLKKRHDAVQRILEVCTELHLTWHDLDSAVESIRHEAYISKSPDGL